jgi:hypothetical protein
MWRSKKLIVFALLAAVLVFGSIGGVVLANGDDEASPPMSLMARVAAKLGISEQVLRDAFAEAHSEMQAERPEGKPLFGGPMTGVFENLGYDQETVQAAFEQVRTELENETLEGGHGAVMSRVLEILGISEADWQAACDEARQAHQEMLGERPEGMPFGPGFGFRGPGGRHGGPFGFELPPDNQ